MAKWLLRLLYSVLSIELRNEFGEDPEFDPQCELCLFAGFEVLWVSWPVSRGSICGWGVFFLLCRARNAFVLSLRWGLREQAASRGSRRLQC
jgi:hypothetical protein